MTLPLAGTRTSSEARVLCLQPVLTLTRDLRQTLSLRAVVTG